MASTETKPCTTKRAVSDAVEEILYEPLPVLDKGFIRVIDYMGNDTAIVQAARVSYGEGTKHSSKDAGLINYLMRNKHTSPFEMCEIKLHVKLPIFVARQWVRHRTANINEYSARYSVMKDEFYMPEIKDVKQQSRTNNQGRGEDLDGEDAQQFIKSLIADNKQCFDSYQSSLSKNIAREISRINLPVNCYTEWYWKIDLHNLLHFIRLREDSHSQHEIREYANVLADIVKRWTPLAYDAFIFYIRDSFTFSKGGVNLLKKKMKGEVLNSEECNLSNREFGEVMDFFKKIES